MGGGTPAWTASSEVRAQPLRGLTSLPNVRCEDTATVISAIDALANGLDFADALHFISSRSADEGFASFDTRFVKRARKIWPDLTALTPP